MKNLKSLDAFINENPELEQVNNKEVFGGKTIDTVKFTCVDTLDYWNCPDTCSTAVGDGMYGTDCN
jgi:hypothetical protein